MKNKTVTKGFTLIEILIVFGLIGIIALPFTNMFIFGVKGTNENAEHVIAYNLAREKIEVIQVLPYDMVKSDFENFKEVFQDRPNFDDAYYQQDLFKEAFTDIFTDMSLTDSEMKISYTRLKNLYPKCMLKQLDTYPESLRYFRRVMEVNDASDPSSSEKNLKKITVYIFNKENKKIAELSTLIGLHQ